jgi:hypothetical protein
MSRSLSVGIARADFLYAIRRLLTGFSGGCPHTAMDNVDSLRCIGMLIEPGAYSVFQTKGSVRRKIFDVDGIAQIAIDELIGMEGGYQGIEFIAQNSDLTYDQAFASASDIHLHRYGADFQRLWVAILPYTA